MLKNEIVVTSPLSVLKRGVYAKVFNLRTEDSVHTMKPITDALLNDTYRYHEGNPFLPLWEHTPDGEPRVFEDPDNPGKYRVYIYPSHDTFRTKYCGTDIVAWSAPVENLFDWRCDGPIFTFTEPSNGQLDILFAPDCVEKINKDGKKEYYLYPNSITPLRRNMVAKSDRPTGSFVACNLKPGTTEAVGDVGFDPAVLVDDDGRVYAYWGFQKSYAAEIDPTTMATIKPGTQIIEGMISSCLDDDNLEQTAEVQKNRFRFFEGSSIRKVQNKYVFIYARAASQIEGWYHSLSYAYSDNPLGPWTYGGIIIRSGSFNTYPKGNIHGSIQEINGKWYVFYHRVTDNTLFARQSMVEPINLYFEGDKLVIDEVAGYTSQGFAIDGLNPYKKHSAGIACYLTGGAYIKATYDKDIDSNPITNIIDNSIAGYKYFNFDKKSSDNKQTQLAINITPTGVAGSIDVYIDCPSESGGAKIGSINILAASPSQPITYNILVPTVDTIVGKHAVYFVFKSITSNVICDFNYFSFRGC